MAGMKVVSMVPSWTETLIRAGIQVVGRTRYCVHPAAQVADIPIVGGTKEVDWDLVIDLNPDLVLLDKEENPLEMAEKCPLPYLATHVSSLQDLQRDLEKLGDHFENATLMEWAVDCYDILHLPRRNWSFRKIPGLLHWVNLPVEENQQIVYMIWKKPWMSVSRETYIGSVLEHLGARLVNFEPGEKYPVIHLEQYRDCFFLFSSEPYPFHKKINELKALGLTGAVIDGESYSWFGVRSLDFLKSLGH